MFKFEPGDYVRCVDPGDTSLVKDQTYYVERGGVELLKVRGIDSYQYGSRFVIVTDKPPERLVVTTTVVREMWSAYDQIWVPQQTVKTMTTEDVKR